MRHPSLIPGLITAGVIAHELRQPIHGIYYVLATRQHIRPKARAGTLRLYDRDALAMVRHELNAIDAGRHRQVVCHSGDIAIADARRRSTPT